MTTQWLRIVALLLWAAGCSLEPNPSPYPMPGGADIWQPGRADAMAAMDDAATSADTTSPGVDAIEPSDITTEDSMDGGDEDVPTDAEELDATEDTETVGLEDALDDASDVSDLDVQTLMEGD